METLTRVVWQLVLKTIDTFNRPEKPAAKYFRDKMMQEVCYERHKAIIKFHLTIILFILIGVFRGEIPPKNASLSIGVCVSMAIAMRLLWYSHPQIVKILYNTLVTIYGPLISWSNREGSHRAWIGTQALPIVVFFCTGSKWHFLFQAGAQLTYLNTIYQPRLLESVRYMTPEAFSKSLSAASTSLGIMSITVAFFTCSALEQAYEKIVVAEKKKDEIERQKVFLLGFSHELRNMINSLMGNVRLAALEKVSDRVRDFLQTADVCGELLLHLINNILDSGKAEIGELEINPVPTNIYETIENIWRVCAELIKRKNLEGKLKISKKIPRVLRVDHYRLTQVFLNLIGNAVKFTDRGSINVIVEWIPDVKQITKKSFEPEPFDEEENELSEGIFYKNQIFSVLDSGFQILTSTLHRINPDLIIGNTCCNQGLLKVTVSDTGHGIPKEDACKLFQKFMQVSSDSSKRKLGTGLGLFITKELCEKMGGEIRVYSKEHKGTCFIFCIPIIPVFNSMVFRPKENNISPRISKDTKMTAIIVDDDHFSRTILLNFFSKLQMEFIETAENGLQGYQKYMEHQNKGESFLIVTMDLTMPIMNGKEAAAKIRQYETEQGSRPCLLIVISGNCSESEIAECTNVHGKIRADAFLKKPAKIDEISALYSQYLTKLELCKPR